MNEIMEIIGNEIVPFIVEITLLGFAFSTLLRFITYGIFKAFYLVNILKK